MSLVSTVHVAKNKNAFLKKIGMQGNLKETLQKLSKDVCSGVMNPSVMQDCFKDAETIYLYTEDSFGNLLGFASILVGVELIYITLICADKQPKGSGRLIFQKIKEMAISSNKKGIFLYAFYKAKPSYKKWGFYEVDQISNNDVGEKYVYEKDFQKAIEAPDCGSYMFYKIDSTVDVPSNPKRKVKVEIQKVSGRRIRINRTTRTNTPTVKKTRTTTSRTTRSSTSRARSIVK